MDETEHMPRYTLTLVDSTGAMEPLILMDDDLKSIAAKLEGRVSAKTRGRLPRGTGGISVCVQLIVAGLVTMIFRV